MEQTSEMFVQKPVRVRKIKLIAKLCFISLSRCLCVSLPHSLSISLSLPCSLSPLLSLSLSRCLCVCLHLSLSLSVGMFAIRSEREYVTNEDFMKAVRKVGDNKKLETKMDYKQL